MADKRMTYEEIAAMFGGEVPMEVVTFVFQAAPPDMTLREVRNHLEEMAERYRARAAWRDVPVTAEFLANIFDAFCGAEGHNLVVKEAMNVIGEKI